MTQQLSPAAQAVFDSYKAASDGCYSGGEWLQNEAGQIAAALRSAVNEVAPEKTIEDISYVHQSYVDGYKVAFYEILIIANEIELQ